MANPKPYLVEKVTTAEEALNESARCLANANEDRAAGKLAAAEKWERLSQYWLDWRNDLAGDGEKRRPKLTPVQRDVLDRLTRAGGRAVVGRGLPFRCNRVTARSLADLGAVTLDGDIYASEAPFTIALTGAASPEPPPPTADAPASDILRDPVEGAAPTKGPSRRRGGPKVTASSPARIESAQGWALHGVVVTVTGATAEQIAATDDMATSFAGTKRDAERPGRYLVRQAPPKQEGVWPIAGDADRELVVNKARRVVDALRGVLAPKKGP